MATTQVDRGGNTEEGSDLERAVGLASSLGVKAPCRAATTVNITLSGEQTIDTVVLVSGDRCLVKNQTDPVENGIYFVQTGSWVRAVDFNGFDDVLGGTIVPVYLGALGSRAYSVVATDPIVIGTSSITFSLTSITEAAAAALIVALEAEIDALAITVASNTSGISDNAMDIAVLDTELDTKLDITAAASAAQFNAGTAEDVFLNPKIARENAWVSLPLQNANAGTSILFTGLPAWATKIEVEGVNVSTDGTTGIGLVIGHAGALETANYTGMCSRIGNSGGVNTTNSNRFTAHNAVIATQGYDFKIYLSKHTGNTWFMNGSLCDTAGSNASFSLMLGKKTLSDVLTQLAFQSASDNFDGSGTIVVRYS